MLKILSSAAVVIDALRINSFHNIWAIIEIIVHYYIAINIKRLKFWGERSAVALWLSA